MTPTQGEHAQPEALRLADALASNYFDGKQGRDVWDAAAAELRRLHAQVAALTAAPQGGAYAELPRVGAIGYASVVDIESYVKTLTIGPRLPGVRDVALWSTDQMRAYADATHALRVASHGQAPAAQQPAPSAAAAPDDWKIPQPEVGGSAVPVTQEDVDAAREKVLWCLGSALLSGSDREARKALNDRHVLYSLLGDANCRLVGSIAPSPPPRPRQTA